jgi:hypothetical protein
MPSIWTSQSTNRAVNCLDETVLSHLVTCHTQRNSFTVYPDISVLQEDVPVPVRHTLRGPRPSALAIAPNGQYLAFHYDPLRSNVVEATMSVTKWPAEPTFHRKPQLLQPVLFTKGNFCFGYERCTRSTGTYRAVVRRVRDWSLMGQRPSGLTRLDRIGNRMYPWEPEWHISGALVIHLSRRKMIFEVWNTLLRESCSMPGSPGSGMVKDLLTSPAGNIVIALCIDFKIYVWRDLTWSKVHGSIAHELQIFSVQDAAYLERATLNGIYLVTTDQRKQFFRYTRSHPKDQEPEIGRTEPFSDGTYVITTQEEVPGGLSSKYTIIANGTRIREFYHCRAASFAWYSDFHAAIVMDTYIVTIGQGSVSFWSKAGRMVKSYRLGARYQGCHGIALAGKHTVIAFDDTLTEAILWEFPRQCPDDCAPPLAFRNRDAHLTKPSCMLSSRLL